MLSQELEFCLNDAFAKARDARHEFLTVEHLLLSILDTPKVREILRACGADLDPAQGLAQRAPRSHHAAPAERRGPRSAAHARLPASPAARGVPRAVLGQEGSRRRQCAHRHLQREAEPRGSPAESRRGHAPRRGQFRLARPVEDRRGEDRQGRNRRRRPIATAKAAARSTSTPPISTSSRRTARSIR